MCIRDSQLDRFCAMPLPLLLGVSCGLELISPDDLFLFAKAASALLASGLSRLQEGLFTAVFTLAASLALLLPFLAVLVGGLSLVLAGYMGWQGVEGLRLG